MKIFNLNSLAVRLKLLTFIWCSLAMASIILTLFLSWRLEGGAAAINDAGSLRMQTYRLGLMLEQKYKPQEIQKRISQFETTLVTLENGDSERPLFLPATDGVRTTLHDVKTQWKIMQEKINHALNKKQEIDIADLHIFVRDIDEFVRAIEVANTQDTYWLRLFQSSLMVMVVLGAGVIIICLYLWVIHPLGTIQKGFSEVHGGRLGVQIPLERLSEFAQVGMGFNQMSTQIKKLYSNLEKEVADKTHDLASKNYTLETLYFFSRFLNKTREVSEACHIFLGKIMDLIPARAGSIRLVDFEQRKMSLIAHKGLPKLLQTDEVGRKIDEYFSEKFIPNNGSRVTSINGNLISGRALKACQRLGLETFQIFGIQYAGQEIGVMTLYFAHDDKVNEGNYELILALCHQLGISLTNIRLGEESRQLAVLQERNLIAQGLHDSIAQTLTFLNLQVQMLESALLENQSEQVEENLNFIRDGLQECYDDVRDLLSNFRAKIHKKDFFGTVQLLAQRFEKQTQIEVEIIWNGEGASLSSEQQLQFIFILQESLSNIRKHAQAQHVEILFENDQNFVMTITDNGGGFDTTSLAHRTDHHIGLSIMHERAARIHAHLVLESHPGAYTRIRLTLPKQERILI